MSEAVSPRHIRFDTDGLQERDRFPAFCDGMFRNIVGADIVQTGAGTFGGALDIRFAGSVIVADIAITPARISRQASHIRDQDDAIVVQLWQRGSAGLIQEDKARNVGAREALVIDNAQPTTLWPDSPARFWALTIPRAALIAAAPKTMHVRGGTIAGDAACQLLRGYLEETRGEEFDDGRSARLVGDHFIELAAAALVPNLDEATESNGIRTARRMAILREIERQRDNPAVAATSVATRLGITPRYVHMLLEESGKSFTHHVLDCRLERAAALLRDPSWHHRRIADVAGEVGFTDLSYFNRTFRRRYGTTPSDMRGASRSDA